MRLAAVHLVRHGNPAAWLDGFIASYRAHDAGIAHRLVVILKGFPDTAGIRLRIAVDLPEASFVEIDDTGFDINAYRHAARTLDCDRLCFLNSHSAIEASGWLARIAGALDDPGIGAAGATASWEAMNQTTPFPNHHLRTTGFAMRRAEFLSLDFGPLATKRDCNWFEGGPNSLTRQVLARARVVVAGRDGLHDPEHWAESRTFRSGNQDNLLISDNRTRAYLRALTPRRRKLARLAWGAHARPAPKPLFEAVAERLGL